MDADEQPRKKCNRCKMNLRLTLFKKKRDDSYMKQCIECNYKKNVKADDYKCEHGRIRWRCIPCGGNSVCEHDRIRIQCRDCGGSQVCKHDRQKSQCRRCLAA